MCTPSFLIWGTEGRVWPWSVYLCMIGYFFVVMWMTSHFCGLKDICQPDSHLCKLLRSSWSLVHSEELWIVRYRRVSSAKELYSAAYPTNFRRQLVYQDLRKLVHDSRPISCALPVLVCLLQASCWGSFLRASRLFPHF